MSEPVEIKGRAVPHHFMVNFSPKAAFMVRRVVEELAAHPNSPAYLGTLSEEEADVLSMLAEALWDNGGGDGDELRAGA